MCAAVNDSQLISIGNDSRALVAWSAGNSSLILAFATSASDNASMTQPVTNLSPISYLGDFFGGNAPGGNPAALQLFSAFLTNVTASNGAISSVIGSENPKLAICMNTQTYRLHFFFESVCSRFIRQDSMVTKVRCAWQSIEVLGPTSSAFSPSESACWYLLT